MPFNTSRSIRSVQVCRAVGLMGWALEVTTNDGLSLLDLDSQAKTWQAGVAMASRRYPNTTVTVSADKFWTKRKAKVKP